MDKLHGDNETETSTAPKPVAYDADGNPLYAAPLAAEPEQPRDSHVHSAPKSYDGHNFDPKMRVQYANEPRVVHHRREYNPEVSQVSEDLQKLHDESKEKYPDLNLSQGECVIASITRHPIGLIGPLMTAVVVIFILLAGLISYPLLTTSSTGEVPLIGPITLILLLLIVSVGIGGYLAIWVYQRNTLYLTNESVIQEIQRSLFSRHEQTVSLGSIEDASYHQNGIIQTTFNYGEIRLSTEGDETTYRFSYVENPKKQLAVLNNAIEAFKNGRPVEYTN